MVNLNLMQSRWIRGDFHLHCYDIPLRYSCKFC